MVTDTSERHFEEEEEEEVEFEGETVSRCFLSREAESKATST